LWGPFALALVLVAAWSGAWVWASGEVGRRMDAARADLDGAGFKISWGDRKVSGYPFRLDVELGDVSAREPSGWALAAPRLKAEAPLYAPDRWVIVLPDGVTFTRPIGGPVRVRAKALRASIASPTRHPPRVAVEGVDLAFEPLEGATPFFVTAAKRLQFNLRPGPNDQGQVYLLLDQASARLSGLFGRVAGERPVSLAGDGTFSHASALQGRDWPAAVRAWSAAGGAMAVREVRVVAGEAVLDARSGTLSVGYDGRLRGSLTAALRQAPLALSAMGQEGAIPPDKASAASAVAAARAEGEVARMTIDFQAGQTTLGPVAIGPAPRVF